MSRGRVDAWEEVVDMSWIQTYTGKKFDLFHPRPENVDIVDIAHALSMQCRFNGHVNRFYSVAEHSVRLSDNVSLKAVKYGLLHDAAEAYVGDIIKPVKTAENRSLEDAILEVILARFGVEVTPDILAEVKEADLRMLKTEKEALQPPGPGYECCEGVEIYPVEIISGLGWIPIRAKYLFLWQFKQHLAGGSPFVI